MALGVGDDIHARGGAPEMAYQPCRASDANDSGRVKMLRPTLIRELDKIIGLMPRHEGQHLFVENPRLLPGD
jgi:hypothetical protein